MNKIKKAQEDASKAIELDEKNMKAFHVMGISLIELGKYEKTVDKIKDGIHFFGLRKFIFLEI